MKTHIKNFLNILSFTSVFVAFTGVSLIFSTSLLFNFPISFELLLITFLIVFSVYNLNRKTDTKEDTLNYPERVSFIRRHEVKITIFSIVSYISAIVIASFISVLAVIITLLPLFGVVVYSFAPLRLKRLLIIKNIWVSLLWSLCVTILPLIYFRKIDLLISPAFISIFLFIFLKGIGNTITFDIRDIGGDKVYNIKTIPIILGVEKTKSLLLFIDILSFILILIATFLGFLPPLGYFISLVTFYTLAYIYLIDKTSLKFLADILADGEFIVIGLLSLIGKYFVG